MTFEITFLSRFLFSLMFLIAFFFAIIKTHNTIDDLMSFHIFLEIDFESDYSDFMRGGKFLFLF